MIDRRLTIFSISILTLVLLIATEYSNSANEIESTNTSSIDSLKIDYDKWHNLPPAEISYDKELFQAEDKISSKSVVRAVAIDSSKDDIKEDKLVSTDNVLLVGLRTDNSSDNNGKLIVNSEYKLIKNIKGEKLTVEYGSVDHLMLKTILTKK